MNSRNEESLAKGAGPGKASATGKGAENACSSAQQAVYMSGVLNNPYFKQVLASSAGSLTSTICLNPITVVKVKLQNFNVEGSPSVSRAISTIYQSKGIPGFFMGVPVGLLMSVPNTTIYMGAYEIIKSNLKENWVPSAQFIVPGVAGACARLLSVSIMSPLELIRTIQTGGVKKSLIDITTDITRNHGLKGLYKGWRPTVLRDCPFSAMYWFGFETMKPYVHSCVVLGKEKQGEKMMSSSTHSSSSSTSSSEHWQQAKSSLKLYSPLTTFISGALAGCIAAVVTHPYDVLKTVLQMQSWTDSEEINENNRNKAKFGNISNSSNISSGNSSSSSSNVSASRRVTSLSSLYKYNGVAGMYRGLLPRLATVIPAGAIMVTIYEALKAVDLDALLLVADCS